LGIVVACMVKNINYHMQYAITKKFVLRTSGFYQGLEVLITIYRHKSFLEKHHASCIENFYFYFLFLEKFFKLIRRNIGENV